MIHDNPDLTTTVQAHLFMIHKEMSDIQRNATASQLPKPAKTGRLECDNRNTISGILSVLTAGCRRADMPDRYGSKPAARLRLQELQQKGIWKKIPSKLIKTAHKQNKINLQKISVGSSSIVAKKGSSDVYATDPKTNHLDNELVPKRQKSSKFKQTSDS